MTTYTLPNKPHTGWPPFGLAQWQPFGLTKAARANQGRTHGLLATKEYTEKQAVGGTAVSDR